MAAAQIPPQLPNPEPRQRTAERYFHFEPLVLANRTTPGARKPSSVTFSLLAHFLLAVLLMLIPLFLDETLPAPDSVVRAFFVAPEELAPPPPPPPPPPVATRRARRAQAAPRPVAKQQAQPEFVAPISIPEEIPPDEILATESGFGIEGGVEGGVPGGVVGGIVGGLPAAPPPPKKVVRVGGAIKAPELIKRVEPRYPALAVQARVQGLVIIEAHVDEHGRVKGVRLLRGVPLLSEAALEAVEQWRYRPLLLNGIPTEFMLSVTVTFSLSAA
jgi:protein TonB